MYKNIFIIAFVAMFLTSCLDKALDVESEINVNYRNFFKTGEDIEKAVYGIVSTNLLNFSGEPVLDITAMNVDNITSISAYKNREFNIYSPERVQGWERYYNVVYQCNSFFYNLTKLEEDISDDLLNFYNGEAHFYKAYAYFEISRMWGDAPIVNDIDDLLKEYKRSDKNEVIDEAIKHAKEACKLLANYEDIRNLDGTSLLSKQVAGKGAAYTLLAELYMWKAYLNNHDTELYKLAEEAASMVIEGNAGYFELAADPEEVCTKVMKRGSDETIFEGAVDLSISFSSYNSQQGSLVGYPVNIRKTAGDIRGDYMPKNTIGHVRNLFAHSGDKRLDAYFYEIDENSTPENLQINGGFAYCYKWRHVINEVDSRTGLPRMKSLNSNVMKWRLAGLILLRAEARARQGKANAIDDLNTIRHRAGLGDYANEDGSNLLDAIFMETERELLFENDRYFRCVRFGKLAKISDVVGALSSTDVENGALFLPVKKSELERNSLLLQTPYWLDK